jgi:hypothetical protein
MKTLTLIAAALLLSHTATATRAAEPAAAAPGGKKVLYHVVSLKFKPDATPDQIEAVETAFVALKEKIPGITSLNWGTNVSPEKHDKGFTHCFVLTFDTEQARNDYLTHPAHKAFGATLGPIMADVMVLDFWSQQ